MVRVGPHHWNGKARNRNRRRHRAGAKSYYGGLRMTDHETIAKLRIVSESELQGQLYLPRRCDRFGNLTRSGVAARRRRKNTRVGLAEVGMIGDVEKFCPELHLLPL